MPSSTSSGSSPDNPYHKPAGFYKPIVDPPPVHTLTKEQRFALMFAQDLIKPLPKFLTKGMTTSTSHTTENPAKRAPYDPLHTLMDTVFRYGDRVPDRTKTGTLELFGTSLIYDLSAGDFPLCTLKATSFKNILVELLWLVSGKSSIEFMHKHGVKHWDPWLPKDKRFGDNDLGRVYGVQWRWWRTAKRLEETREWIPKVTDQLENLIEGMKQDPHGRRHLVTAWNPGELDQMALPPCHLLFQCHIDSNKRISMQVYQRSADLFIGVPYDVGMYALLLNMICKVMGPDYSPKTLIFNFGSTHIYLNHLEQVEELLGREHKAFPQLVMSSRKINSLDDFTVDDFEIIGYDAHPFIKAPVAV